MSKTDPIVLTAETPDGRIKEITDRLEQGVTELFESDRYKEYLRVMSKFHNYSFNNTLLIAMQKPDATYIAGYNAWKSNFGRNVMKGEKGIRILAPSPYNIKQKVEKIDPGTQKPVTGKDGNPVTEEKEITIPAYKVVSVFDVSQTEGKELPTIDVDMLTGDVDRYKDFFAALEKTSPVPISFENIEGGTHGYYHLVDKRIAIQKDMSELQTLKTAIHEIAHAKLHDIDLKAPKDTQKQLDSNTREVEAESVAYTVCQHYSLDTSEYSFGYVAGWSSGRELSELKGSLETIRKAASEIINSIDGYFAELQKMKEIDKGKVESNIKEFFDDFSKNNRDGMLKALYNFPFTASPAKFTTNGNAVESQEALIEKGEYKVSVGFFNGWNPMQVVPPTKPIKQTLGIVLYKNGNPTAIHTLVEKKSMSLKNAERNYHEMLKQWKNLTKQQEIYFDSHAEKMVAMDKGELESRPSVLKYLHHKQKEINCDQKMAEQKTIEKSDKGMER